MSFERTVKTPKSKFTPEEDIQLVQLILSRQDHDWSWIADQMPGRNPRQCRERWTNYLNPNLNHGEWTDEEDKIILEKRETYGAKWAVIASYLNGRSGNDVRNRWLMLMRHQNKTKAQKSSHQKQNLTYSPMSPISQIKAQPVLTAQPVLLPISQIETNNIQNNVYNEAAIPKPRKLFAPILSLVPDISSTPLFFI